MTFKETVPKLAPFPRPEPVVAFRGVIKSPRVRVAAMIFAMVVQGFFVGVIIQLVVTGPGPNGQPDPISGAGVVAGGMIGAWIVVANLVVSAAWLWAVGRMLAVQISFLHAFDVSILAGLPLCVVSGLATPVLAHGGYTTLTSSTWLGVLAVISLAAGLAIGIMTLHRRLRIRLRVALATCLVWAVLPAGLALLF